MDDGGAVGQDRGAVGGQAALAAVLAAAIAGDAEACSSLFIPMPSGVQKSQFCGI